MQTTIIPSSNTQIAGHHIAAMADAKLEPLDPIDPILQQQKAAMLADEDPLLISQSLTYVTDDGSTLHTFHAAPLSNGK
jgi:hypothetical protein